MTYELYSTENLKFLSFFFFSSFISDVYIRVFLSHATYLDERLKKTKKLF